MKLRFIFPLVIVALLAVAALPAPVAAGTFPNVIQLPVGWQPEGIAVGNGHTFFSGSVATGAVIRGDLRSGSTKILVQPRGFPATGMKFDPRSDFLFVAGGPSGLASVYNASSGALAQTFTLSTSTNFINDVIVTRQAAYFTNSFEAVFYVIPLGPDGQLPANFSDVKTVALSGDWVQPAAGMFGANGIVATPDGKWLIIVDTADGTLFRVNPWSGEATKIDLGVGTVTFGDGLALRGHTLYVVRNQLNEIAVVQLSPDLTSGVVVKTLTNPNLNVPTTIAFLGAGLYTVNAKFGAPNPETLPYEVVRVPLH